MYVTYTFQIVQLILPSWQCAVTNIQNKVAMAVPFIVAATYNTSVHSDNNVFSRIKRNQKRLYPPRGKHF